MSSLLYGALLGERMISSPGHPPAVTTAVTLRPEADAALPGGAAPADQPTPPGGAAPADQPTPPPQQPDAHKDMKKIGYWQDALAVLVPAEVLAIHGIAVSIAQTAKVTLPLWVFVVLILIAFALSFLATLFKDPLVLYKKVATYIGALIAAGAFVLWAMLQPESAFDSINSGISALNRVLVPLFGALILGVIAGAMAKFEQAKSPSA